jgi:uncharacterized protein (DUF2236 family)
MFKDLSRLFATPSRAKVLKFFVLQSELRTTPAVVSGVIGVSKTLVEKELQALARLGVITSRKQKKITQFMLDDSYPLAEQLRTFFQTTMVPSDSAIANAFRPIRGLTLLVTTGVLTQESRSSIDLLVVTKKPRDIKIGKAVKRIEAAMALPVRYAVIESEDYAGRMESYDRLLRDVFEFEHRVVLGRK